MGEIKKINKINTPNGEDLWFTDNEAVHNGITDKILMKEIELTNGNLEEANIYLFNEDGDEQYKEYQADHTLINNQDIEITYPYTFDNKNEYTGYSYTNNKFEEGYYLVTTKIKINEYVRNATEICGIYKSDGTYIARKNLDLVLSGYSRTSLIPRDWKPDSNKIYTISYIVEIEEENQQKLGFSYKFSSFDENNPNIEIEILDTTIFKMKLIYNFNSFCNYNKFKLLNNTIINNEKLFLNNEKNTGLFIYENATSTDPALAYRYLNNTSTFFHSSNPIARLSSDNTGAIEYEMSEYFNNQKELVNKQYVNSLNYVPYTDSNQNKVEITGSLINGSDNCEVSGYLSHAEGKQTTASGNYSHAEGDQTTASGDYSHAEGDQTTASGDYSHAEGFHTTASYSYSHAEGSYTTALHIHSHAEGENTKTSKAYQHVCGKYNDDNSDALFIIGNGTGPANNERSNALEILENGTINLSSNKARITNVANPTDSYDAVNKRYVDNLLNISLTNLKHNNLTSIQTLESDRYSSQDGSLSCILYFNGENINFTVYRNGGVAQDSNYQIKINNNLVYNGNEKEINEKVVINYNNVNQIELHASMGDLVFENFKFNSFNDIIHYFSYRIAALEQQLTAQSNS